MCQPEARHPVKSGDRRDLVESRELHEWQAPQNNGFLCCTCRTIAVLFYLVGDN